MKLKPSSAKPNESRRAIQPEPAPFYLRLKASRNLGASSVLDAEIMRKNNPLHHIAEEIG